MTDDKQSRIRQAALALGLHEEVAELVAVLPLVYVAWADGEIQADEFQIIMGHARELEFQNPRSLEILSDWLVNRPDRAFFDKGLKLLSHLLADLPEEEVSGTATDLATLCRAVAVAAGGSLGHTIRIDAREQIAMRKVAIALDLGESPRAKAALEELLGLAR